MTTFFAAIMDHRNVSFSDECKSLEVGHVVCFFHIELLQETSFKMIDCSLYSDIFTREDVIEIFSISSGLCVWL